MDDAFVSGTLTGKGTYEVGVNLLRSSLPRAKTAMFCRIMENWCGNECAGEWRIEQNNAALIVAFDNTRDWVIFKLTPEFDYLVDIGPEIK